MSSRTLASIAALAIFTAALLPAQSKTDPAKAKTWNLPRTPDGHPDLQGIWTNATLTPLERSVVIAITGERVGAPSNMLLAAGSPS
jgi:hypothetical protein